MTRIEIRSRDATSHPSYDTPRFRAVTTGLDPVVHAEDQQANAGGSIRNGMDCLALTSEAKSMGRCRRGKSSLRGRSDEAIQVGTLDWIASLTLAMTIRFRDAPEHSNHAK
jgi:hypothetical protein